MILDVMITFRKRALSVVILILFSVQLWDIMVAEWLAFQPVCMKVSEITFSPGLQWVLRILASKKQSYFTT